MLTVTPRGPSSLLSTLARIHRPGEGEVGRLSAKCAFPGKGKWRLPHTSDSPHVLVAGLFKIGTVGSIGLYLPFDCLPL